VGELSNLIMLETPVPIERNDNKKAAKFAKSRSNGFVTFNKNVFAAFESLLCKISFLR
jgi:hypothetical protein